MRFLSSLFVLCCLIPSTAVVVADNPTAIHLSPGSNWFNRLNGSGLNPGDEVVLSAGTYTHGGRLSFNSFGTAENPIIVRAAEGAKVVIRRNNASQNVMDIEGAQYVTFRGIEISGGSAGIRIRGKSGRHPTALTFEDMIVRNVADGGITANDPGWTYDNLIFRRNEITATGGLAGYYLGCNNGSGGSTACVFKNGLIEGNYVYNLGGGVGDGIQIKDGSYNNVIRDNVVHNTGGGGSVGILVYGTDGNARNIIEGNVIWASGDNAIQAASEATIRNNIIFSSGRGLSGISSQNHQSAVTGNLTIVNNTVFSRSGDNVLSINHSGALSGPVIVANNALYAVQSGRAIRVPSSGDVTVVGNVGTGSDSPSSLSNDSSAWDPTGNLFADFGGYFSMDAFPIPGSDLIGAGDANYQPDVDFNGVSRAGTNDVGAYVFDPNGNPGWEILSGFKEFPELLAGDFDNDEDVDGADFLAWQRNTSLGSLSEWETNFGMGVGALASTAVVPEPSAIALALVAGCGLLCVRRSRQFRFT